jgi:hypothetical protein
MSVALIKIRSDPSYIRLASRGIPFRQALREPRDARKREIAMCGRYVIFSTPEAIRALFRYGEQPNFPPRYNVAPTQPIPVVRLVDGKRSFALMPLGPLTVTGQGAENLSASDQCPRRIRARQAGIPQRHSPAPLSHSNQRLL